MKQTYIALDYFEGLDNIKILRNKDVEYNLIKLDAKLSSLRDIADTDDLKEIYNKTLRELRDYCLTEMNRIGFTLDDRYSGSSTTTYIYDERLGKELRHPNYQRMYIAYYARLYWSEPEKYPLKWTQYTISDYLPIAFMFQLYEIRHDLDMGFYEK